MKGVPTDFHVGFFEVKGDRSKLVVEFPFNTAIVAVIKQLHPSSRSWNPAQKFWTIQTSTAAEFIEMLNTDDSISKAVASAALRTLCTQSAVPQGQPSVCVAASEPSVSQESDCSSVQLSTEGPSGARVVKRAARKKCEHCGKSESQCLCAALLNPSSPLYIGRIGAIPQPSASMATANRPLVELPVSAANTAVVRKKRVRQPT